MDIDYDLFVFSNIKGIGKISLGKIADFMKSERIGGLSGVGDYISVLESTRRKMTGIKLVSEDDVALGIKKSDKIIENSELLGINIIGKKSKDFPVALKWLRDCPHFLHTKGNTSILNRDCVAIIGTRDITQHGLVLGERLSKQIIALSGFVVVSGLAVGCDTVGHKAALSANTPTIAIMAHGLDIVYPRQNKKLAEDIVDAGGCLISEYPIGYSIKRSSFVERDRLQSGLSKGVVVIETGVKGGTMHTVGFAKQQKRVVGCLYTHALDSFRERWFFHDKFAGNRNLVGGGAYQLDSPEHIKDFVEAMMSLELGLAPPKKLEKVKNLFSGTAAGTIKANEKSEGVFSKIKNKTKEIEKKVGDAFLGAKQEVFRLATDKNTVSISTPEDAGISINSIPKGLGIYILEGIRNKKRVTLCVGHGGNVSQTGVASKKGVKDALENISFGRGKTKKTGKEYWAELLKEYDSIDIGWAITYNPPEKRYLPQFCAYKLIQGYFEEHGKLPHLTKKI